MIGLAGVTYWIYRDLHTPVNHTKASRFIEIPRGSGPAAVAKRLASEGVITHQWPLELYMKFTGASARLKAGDYKLPSPITPLAVLKRLEQGEQRMIRLTVIEGWTRWDIANAMIRIPELEINDSGSALRLMDDVTLIKELDPEARILSDISSVAPRALRPHNLSQQKPALFIISGPVGAGKTTFYEAYLK